MTTPRTIPVPIDHLPALLACAETLARRHEAAAEKHEAREVGTDDELEAAKARASAIAARRRSGPFRALIAVLGEAEAQSQGEDS